MNGVARIRVPVRLCADIATMCGDGLDALEAFDRGVRRATAHARGVLGDGSAALLALGPGEVTIRWSGTASDRVPMAARERLEHAIRGRIAAALATPSRDAPWGSASGDRRGRWSDEAERADRWNVAGEYLLPSYDQAGAGLPVTVDQSPAIDPHTTEQVLYPFTSYAEVLQKVREFFPNPAPRGGRLYGVYGQWVPSGYPTLFWLKELPDFVRAEGFVTVQLQDGKVIPTSAPIGYAGGRIYRLRVLPKPKQHRGTEYWFERAHADGSHPQPVFLNYLRDELRGWELHFAVAVVEQETITIRSTPSGPDPGIPTWQLFGASNLGWVPDNGLSPLAWWFLCWLNIQPAELRQDAIVKQIFERWASEKTSLNILFIYLHVGEFYREYCFGTALQMLAESRKNMEDFLQVIQQPNHPWAQRFDSVVRFLAPVGEQIEEMETGLAWRYSMDLQTTREQLSYQEGLQASQEESLAAGRGGLPGGIIRTEDVENLRAAVARIEQQQQAAARELPKAQATLSAAETLEPLLVVLTTQGGEQVAGLSEALSRYAPGRSTEPPSSWVRREFGALIETSRKAENNMRDNPDKVYQIVLVRQVVDPRLQGWFAANPMHAETIRKMVEGLGILDWLLIGLALLVITLACPPLGAGLAVGVGGASLASSFGQWRRFRVYSRARLAQFGFVPLVSEAEVNSAMLAVVLDTVFLFVDLKGFGSALGGARRVAARGTLQSFEEGMERVVASVKRTHGWPESLSKGVRSQVEEVAKREGALAGRSIDEVVEVAKGEMALRYERHVLGARDELARLLERPELTGEELQRWLTQKVRPPTDFLDDLTKELREGTELWEEVAGKLRPGARAPLGAGFEFLPHLSDEARQALREELGPLADTLTPDRLLLLGTQAEVAYPALARRLNTLLARTPDPGRSLQLLEDLCHGRSDAGAILRTLETQARPAELLEYLTPTLLDGLPGTSVQELLEAMSRTTEAGTIERFYYHTRLGGEVALARDIEKDGRIMIQRWGGPERGWQIYRRFGPRPQFELGAAARRAAEESTLASVVEGNARASRGLARLSERGRHILLEELEDAALEPALTLRLLEDIEALPERSLDALAAIKRADDASGGLLAETWIDVMEHSRGWRDELLRLVGEVHDVVESGLSEAVRRGMSGATNIQGSLGHLHAAVTLRRLFPNATMSFEVEALNREIDIVVHDGARNLDVEVKTNLGQELSINLSQIRKDLIRHAADQGHDLLYLYHPDAAARLVEVRAAMREEAQAVLTPAAAAEVNRRLDDIVRVYQLY